MKVYKGTNKDMQCTPGGKVFQYEQGVTYEKPKAELCAHGFHACEAPLDVLGYYAPGKGSRYFEAELEDVSPDRREDSKVCGKKITLGAEIGIPGLAKAHVEYVKEHIDTGKMQTNTGSHSAATNTGSHSAATNTGIRSAATNTGYASAATNTGYASAATNTGNRSAATNTGDTSAATNTGSRSAATNTGYASAATNTGSHSAATNTGDVSAATNTGDASAATNTGSRSAATNTGIRSAATNTGIRSAASVAEGGSVAIVTGYQSIAKAGIGSAIVICERGGWNGTTYPLLAIKAAIVDGETIKPDTWYTLKNGEFVEVKDDE